MIYKGLDDDEADFLTYVVDTKAKKHVEAVQQEQEEISAFRVRLNTKQKSKPSSLLYFRMKLRVFLMAVHVCVYILWPCLFNINL